MKKQSFPAYAQLIRHSDSDRVLYHAVRIELNDDDTIARITAYSAAGAYVEYGADAVNFAGDEFARWAHDNKLDIIHL